jgi:hypothetical protein
LDHLNAVPVEAAYVVEVILTDLRGHPTRKRGDNDVAAINVDCPGAPAAIRTPEGRPRRGFARRDADFGELGLL